MIDSKECWYRKLDFPTTEFRWTRRKGPGLPYILEVRSTSDNAMKFEYEVMDIATAPIQAYLRLAEARIIEVMEQRAKDDKRKRSEQFDRTERERIAQTEANAAKEQLPQGQVREPERQADGGVEKDDHPRRNDEVQPGGQPDIVKKKRGRPRKDRNESRAGSEAG